MSYIKHFYIVDCKCNVFIVWVLLFPFSREQQWLAPVLTGERSWDSIQGFDSESSALTPESLDVGSLLVASVLGFCHCPGAVILNCGLLMSSAVSKSVDTRELRAPLFRSKGTILGTSFESSPIQLYRLDEILMSRYRGKVPGGRYLLLSVDTIL